MPVQNFNHKASRVIASGITGTGKSTVLEYLARGFTGDHVIIFDWQDAEFGTNRFGLEKISGSFKDVARQIRDREKIISYWHKDIDVEPEIELERFASFIMQVADVEPREWLIIIDETGQFLNHKKMSPETKRMLVAGRRKNIDMAMSCHQLNNISFELRQHVTEAFLFRHSDELSLKIPREYGVPEEICEKIRTLPDTHYLYLDNRSNEHEFGKLIF